MNFKSEFGKSIMYPNGVQLRMSSSRHQQTDGVGNIMHPAVGTIFICYFPYHQDDLNKLLHATDFDYGSSF